MFDNKSTREQAREVSRLIMELGDIVPVAVCSGNHDNAGGLVSHDLASPWRAPKHHNGRATRKLEDLILTTIPYHCPKEQKSIWLDRGLTIRRQTGKPWMVLHHAPPKTGSGVSGEESEAAALLLAYRPDYFVSGHDHAFPYKTGQSWNQKMGEVCALVPGQLMSAPFPNHSVYCVLEGDWL